MGALPSRRLNDRLSPSPLTTPAAASDAEAAVGLARAQAAVAEALAVPGALFLLAATVVWWPLDAWVMPTGAFEEGFRAMRLRAVAVELVAVIGFVASRELRALAIHVVPLLYTIWVGLVGEALGGIASDDLTPLADAWMAMVPLVILPQAFAIRLAWVLASAAALVGGYFGLHPAKLEVAGAAMQLSFGVFAVALTAALGEMSYRVFRYGYFQQRARDQANAELAAMTASLATIVDERTAELRELAAHLTTVQEAERRRVARDLHDDLGQNLTALRYSVARLERHVHGEAAADLIDDIGAVLDGTFATVRGVLSDLRPRILDDLGLVPALEWMVERLGASELRVTLEADAAARDVAAALSHEAALALFRVAQEASTNAVRHGRASTVRFVLRAEDGALRFEVADDGSGFEPGAASPGFGLLGLRERMLAIGGEFALDAAPGAGTRVVAKVKARPSA